MAVTIVELVEARFQQACKLVELEMYYRDQRPWRVLRVLLDRQHVGWVLRHYLADFYLVAAAPDWFAGVEGCDRAVWRHFPHARLWPDPDRATGLHDPAAILRVLVELDPDIDLPS